MLQPIVCYMLRTTINHFIFPIRFERKYQVAAISLVKLNIRRKINQPVEKVKIGGLPKPRYDRKKCS